MKMNEIKRFCVVCPKQVDVPYINVYGIADSKSGFRFEIVAEFDDKYEAVKKRKKTLAMANMLLYTITKNTLIIIIGITGKKYMR